MGPLITGATASIGPTLTHQLNGARYRLALVARDHGKLATLAEGVGNAVPIAAHLTDAPAAQAAIDHAWQRVGPFVAFAHCVRSILVKPLHLTSDGEATAQLQSNYVSAFLTPRAVVSLALKHRQPMSIVLVSSIDALHGFPNHEAISSAKSAVAGLTMSAAATNAARGIRVNVVAPGLTRAGLSARFIASPQAEARAAAAIPLARIGEPRDTAALIEFVLSDRSDYITGQEITVAGGQGTLRLPPRTLA
jgi:NAD(P)-dependent dehydrogenase (short-subunit alcohol dehydrogenase family)